MHIKHIHDTLEKLSSYACEYVSQSVESIDTCELEKVTDMIKNLSEAEYYSIIAKEMKKAEEEDEAEEKYMLKSLKEEYGEDDGRRYYDMWRYKSGRFAPKSHGTRRGYDDPPYYHTMSEYGRDFDRDKGRMYYTEPMHESRYEKAKRYYEETKMHSEDKSEKMKELENYLKELSEDITKIISDASADEKTMIKNKMQTLTSKM